MHALRLGYTIIFHAYMYIYLAASSADHKILYAICGARTRNMNRFVCFGRSSLSAQSSAFFSAMFSACVPDFFSRNGISSGSLGWKISSLGCVHTLLASWLRKVFPSCIRQQSSAPQCRSLFWATFGHKVSQIAKHSRVHVCALVNGLAVRSARRSPYSGARCPVYVLFNLPLVSVCVPSSCQSECIGFACSPFNLLSIQIWLAVAVILCWLDIIPT